MTQKLDRRTRYTRSVIKQSFFGTAPKVSLSESHSHGYLQKGGNYTGYVLLALYGYLCLVRRHP